MYILASILTLSLAQAALAQKTAVTSSVLAELSRYAAFASAAYSDNCVVPPFGATVDKFINDEPTSTQVTLFRDDAAKEFILSFRGTSDVQDFLTDLDQDLVPCSAAAGITCTNCTVSDVANIHGL